MSTFTCNRVLYTFTDVDQDPLKTVFYNLVIFHYYIIIIVVVVVIVIIIIIIREQFRFQMPF